VVDSELEQHIQDDRNVQVQDSILSILNPILDDYLHPSQCEQYYE
jgi:hypothetical protein